VQGPASGYGAHHGDADDRGDHCNKWPDWGEPHAVVDLALPQRQHAAGQPTEGAGQACDQAKRAESGFVARPEVGAGAERDRSQRPGTGNTRCQLRSSDPLDAGHSNAGLERQGPGYPYVVLLPAAAAMMTMTMIRK
jgi:hypothetical protein